MNTLQLPPEIDLPLGRAEIRRDLLVTEITRVSRAKPMWRRPATFVAVAAAVVIGIVVVPLTGGNSDGQVLAYALAAGDELEYQFAYDSSTSQTAIGELPAGLTLGGAVTVTAQGHIAYTIDQGPDPETLVVHMIANGAQVVSEDGVPFEGETADTATWPTVDWVVDTRGRVLEWLVDESVEVPGFLVQSPLQGQADKTILPYAFGPTFPEDAVDVGDTWTTEQAPFDCEAGAQDTTSTACESESFAIGEHRVVREEVLNGRSTVVIESTYTEPPQREYEVLTVSNEATVWFDPADGIIVKVEWASSLESERRPTAGNDPMTPVDYASRNVRHETFTAELVTA